MPFVFAFPLRNWFRSLEDTFSPFDRERNITLKKIGTSLIVIDLLMFVFFVGSYMYIAFDLMEVGYSRLVPLFLVNISPIGMLFVVIWSLYVPPPFAFFEVKDEGGLRTGFLISDPWVLFSVFFFFFFFFFKFIYWLISFALRMLHYILNFWLLFYQSTPPTLH